MAEVARRTARTPEWLARAAVLSVFDVDWIEPDPELDDAIEEELTEFLADSCERVTDVSGTPRWQLRDDERSRVLRSTPVPELADALSTVTSWLPLPAEPVQTALARYLGFGTKTPPEPLDAAGLSAELQVARWTGQQTGAMEEIQARLEWLEVVESLRRLADGFVGRRELLTE